MSIALTGGTGFVGQAVLDAASRMRIPIRALARRPQDVRPGVEWIEGRLDDPDSLARLVSGADAVVHVAGLTNTPDPAEFHNANVAGTEALLDAAGREGIERFVFTSSLSAREPSLSAYGASKTAAEKLFEGRDMDWTIVRPPAVYGPRDRDMFELFRAAKFGIVPVPPRGRTSLIHVEDLADLLLTLVPERKSLSGHIVEPDDARPGGYEHGELARLIGSAVGRRVFAPALPKMVLGLAAAGDRLLRGDAAKLTPDRVGYMIHPDWVCRPELAVPKGLWTPRIEGAEGLAQTARWYRQHGWL